MSLAAKIQMYIQLIKKGVAQILVASFQVMAELTRRVTMNKVKISQEN